MPLSPPAGWTPPVLLLGGGVLDVTGAVGMIASGRSWAIVLVVGGLVSLSGALLLLLRRRRTVQR